MLHDLVTLTFDLLTLDICYLLQGLCGWEVPWMLLLDFFLREAFQSQTNTEKILYNKSR